jgi:hypothetical protein
VLLCGYLFLHARSRPWPSAILAAGFVMASVVPVYFVQIMPEVFNFSLAFLAYFCWLYKEVAAPGASPRGTAWLFTGRATSRWRCCWARDVLEDPRTRCCLRRPSLWWLFACVPRRRTPEVREFRRRNVLVVARSSSSPAASSAINMAISATGTTRAAASRKSYYYEFPFQNDVPAHELGASKSRERRDGEVIFNPRTSVELCAQPRVLLRRRHAGCCRTSSRRLRDAADARGARRRPLWQWLVLASALAQGSSSSS